MHVAVLVAPEFTDVELVVLFQAGDVQALNLLLERYRRFARAKARGYFLAGADSDDIEQEGMIGLYKAARDFRPDRHLSFRAFADLCVTRQMITAIKTATRQKHRPLNQYVSLCSAGSSDEPEDWALEELLDDHHAPDPADEVVMAERLDDMQAALARMLSGLEVQVLALFLEGWSYQEISCHVGRPVKSVDNALQRIKRKLEVHLETRVAQEAREELATAVA